MEIPYTDRGSIRTTDSDPSHLNPSGESSSVNPTIIKRHIEDRSVTVAELAEREGDDKVVFTEIFPGVYADRTDNPLQPVIDPETGEPQVNLDTGEVVMSPQPYKDADGTVIDYEKKQGHTLRRLHCGSGAIQWIVQRYEKVRLVSEPYWRICAQWTDMGKPPDVRRLQPVTTG